MVRKMNARKTRYLIMTEIVMMKMSLAARADQVRHFSSTGDEYCSYFEFSKK